MSDMHDILSESEEFVAGEKSGRFRYQQSGSTAGALAATHFYSCSCTAGGSAAAIMTAGSGTLVTGLSFVSIEASS